MSGICNLCPRNCNVKRDENQGFCSSGSLAKISRAALHMWEEPCISGKCGSGTVFFSGCNLKCIFCQNHKISSGGLGMDVSPEKLSDIYFALEQEGAHNINLVTGTHFVAEIIKSIEIAKRKGIKIPFVYNTGTYEHVKTIKMLSGLIDVYMPDFKYFTSETARDYSRAPDYPEIAKLAIDEMVSQCPAPIFDSEGILKKGVIIRHLLLPGHVYEGKQIMKYLWGKYSDSVLYSIMSQYTPLKEFENHPKLSRRVKKKEYESLVDFCLSLGMENAYIQEGEAAKESFIPDFDELKIPHI